MDLLVYFSTFPYWSKQKNQPLLTEVQEQRRRRRPFKLHVYHKSIAQPVISLLYVLETTLTQNCRHNIRKASTHHIQTPLSTYSWLHTYFVNPVSLALLHTPNCYSPAKKKKKQTKKDQQAVSLLVICYLDGSLV